MKIISPIGMINEDISVMIGEAKKGQFVDPHRCTQGLGELEPSKSPILSALKFGIAPQLLSCHRIHAPKHENIKRNQSNCRHRLTYRLYRQHRQHFPCRDPRSDI